MLEETGNNQTLQRQAYQTLRRAIIFAQYKPGERLVPKDLCEELGLGRTPVREGLVRLQQQGLVRTVPQSGTFVSKVDGHAAESARFTREHLEQQIVIECCARATDSDIRALNDIIEQQLASVEAHDERQFFITDNRMHELLFEIADRREVWDWLELTNTHFERYRWLAATTRGVSWDVVMDQHQRIRDAIVARDTNEASYLIIRHLHKALADYHEVAATHPEYFDNTNALVR